MFSKIFWLLKISIMRDHLKHLGHLRPTLSNAVGVRHAWQFDL